jgi:hypothetical protein
MIVGDLNVESVPGLPSKADPELIVDAYAVEAWELPNKVLQTNALPLGYPTVSI